MISKRDIPGALLVLLKNLRCRFFSQHSLVFGINASDLLQKKFPGEIADYQLKEINAWNMVDETMKQTFAANKEDIWWDTESMLKKGSCLWIGYLKGKTACILWTTNGDRMDSYFFPLTPQCVVISHCATLKPYRGLGLYPASLVYLTKILASRNIERFYIHCTDWNVPSIKGIKRAGFNLLGRGIATKKNRLSWYPNKNSQQNVK